MTSASLFSNWRRTKDRLATVLVTVGGGGVLFTILLIFLYLLYEITPLFSFAKISEKYSIELNEQNEPVYATVEEHGEVILAIDKFGIAKFINGPTGEKIHEQSLDPDGLGIQSVSSESAESALIAVAYRDKSVALFRHEYQLSYPGGIRQITPRIERVYSSAALTVDHDSVEKLFVRDSDNQLSIASLNDQGRVSIKIYSKQENFLTGEISFTEKTGFLPAGLLEVHDIFIGSEQRWLYLLTKTNDYQILDLRKIKGSGILSVIAQGTLYDQEKSITSSTFLLGGLSLLIATEGEISQYFMVRRDKEYRFERVRSFDTGGLTPIAIVPEHRRKGFFALMSSGDVQVFHATSQRKLLGQAILSESNAQSLIPLISPRGKQIITVDSTSIKSWALDNEHPEVSWSVLWDKVWYESYSLPEFIWQSSASTNDFEPKYSFAPLVFGTLKAAFYTMIIAAPLAIMAAIFTAYFMAGALQQKIKPLIEIMQALPTVILGFLAGLWLAPLIEGNLSAVFLVVIMIPISTLVFAFVWSRLPSSITAIVPAGWQAALLLPVIVAVFWISFSINDYVELVFFQGSMSRWITTSLGISFDQRNSLVVGIAMGIAVIPTIFSIAEDAVYSVPRHLTDGSLALGATPWQTLVRVVLPTASPGIFSALMIGFGRAVGETMIVLMATGNTPIMDINIFEGMRTLSANIAVEIPEAEVESTHYRILFLAAFVLFLFTFIVNTGAEIVRQRLRIRYGSL